MRHNYFARLGDIFIRQLKEEDIELLRKWRNDPESTRFLRNIGYITEEMQMKWYESYLDNKQDFIFAIEDTGELKRVVGSLSLYDWNKKQGICEIGRIQIGDSAAHGKGIGRKSFVMALKIAFHKLNTEKIVASVHPNNVQAYYNYMKIGFHVIGEAPTLSVVGGNELLLEIFEGDLQNNNSYYDQIEI